jgi:hypothetical protein
VSSASFDLTRCSRRTPLSATHTTVNIRIVSTSQSILLARIQPSLAHCDR